MRRVVIAVLLLLAVAGPAAGPLGAAGKGETQRLAELEAGILAGLNAERGARGLRPLVLSAGLQAAARAHSRAMLERGLFEHTSPNGTSFSDRIRRFYPARGFQSWSVGENLLYNSEQPSPADAIAAWLDSPSHRRNMLSPAWREVGIAGMWAASAPGYFAGGGASIVTMDFGARAGKLRTTASR